MEHSLERVPPIPAGSSLPFSARKTAEPPPDAAAIREDHILSEMRLRLTGLALLGWAVLTTADRIRNFDQQLALFDAAPRTWLTSAAGELGLPLAAGLALAFLRPSARIAGNALALLWLVGLSLGFVPAVYILCFVNSAKGRRILHPTYGAICRATPEQSSGFWAGILLAGALILLMVLSWIDTSLRAENAAAQGPGKDPFHQPSTPRPESPPMRPR